MRFMTRLIGTTLIIASPSLLFGFGRTASVQATTVNSHSKELSFESGRSVMVNGEHAVPQRRRRSTTSRSRSRIKAVESEDDSKPSPLTLLVRVRQDRKIFLNGDELGQPDDSHTLVARLLEIFADREKQRTYKIGMERRADLPESERIEKQVYFQAHSTLKEEEAAKLIEDIKKTGANPVTVLSEEEYKQKFGWVFEPEKYGWLPPGIKKTPASRKIVNGGVLNGKALSLPRPPYPASAKSLHISSTVAVRVIIDETGKVISARAVSGHPLLRQAAVDAARQATFAPTILLGQAVSVKGVITYTFVGNSRR